jgi:hypothetical protein
MGQKVKSYIHFISIYLSTIDKKTTSSTQCHKFSKFEERLDVSEDENENFSTDEDESITSVNIFAFNFFRSFIYLIIVLYFLKT